MLNRLSENCYVLPRQGSMKTEVKLFVSEDQLQSIKQDDSLSQLRDAASMPGVEAVIGMPDIHQGFGLPIGGVMVMAADSGVISAGAVGMDINCGVRLLKTGLTYREFDMDRINQLMGSIAAAIPTGIGTTSPLQNKLEKHLDDIVVNGVKKLVDIGLTSAGDLNYIQDQGSYPGAAVDCLSSRARERMHQLGTLGGGNHFIELDRVAEIFDSKIAENFSLNKDQLVIQIHSGSRGFGHQICKDYSAEMNSKTSAHGVKLPSRGLAAAPINSTTGKNYLKAMAAAANFAYANRQLMTELIRRVFRERADLTKDSELALLYDISHNLARFETINQTRYLIHRKGAVRALPRQHPETPDGFQTTGHPILVPGTMGTSSYILTASEKLRELYYSVNHGAGRKLSRTAAKKTFSRDILRQQMQNISIHGARINHILDEAPGAYKEIDRVIGVLADPGLTNKVARLQPVGVIKGN